MVQSTRLGVLRWQPLQLGGFGPCLLIALMVGQCAHLSQHTGCSSLSKAVQLHSARVASWNTLLAMALAHLVSKRNCS